MVGSLSAAPVWWGASVLIAGWLAIPAHSVEASTISIRWETNSNRLTVEVVGVPEKALRHLQSPNWPAENWHKVFSIYAGQDDFLTDMSIPGVSGNYSIEGVIIRFQSKFPLTRGVKYRAVFRPERLPEILEAVPGQIVSTFSLPVEQHERTTVVNHIYPSGDVLPENLLKFYLHFSAPMQGGHIYEHIHLRDETGKPVELPFLEIDEELWNLEMTRLTLFIDPGRIKRGVKPLEEIGPALEKGKQYTLEIDANWLDGRGAPLRENFRKTFRVGAADREPPSLATWKINSPKAGSREPLKVTFPEPMDHALALRVISVANPVGQLLSGTSALSDLEQLWTFVPRQLWSAGKHQLQVQNTIEDLAGNNIGKVFEVDLFDGVQRRFTNAVVTLRFEVH